jgi:hypothetical protein
MGPNPGPYAEAMAAWRTSCPHLRVWEDANDRGLITRHHTAVRSVVSISNPGVELVAIMASPDDPRAGAAPGVPTPSRRRSGACRDRRARPRDPVSAVRAPRRVPALLADDLRSRGRPRADHRGFDTVVAFGIEGLDGADTVIVPGFRSAEPGAQCSDRRAAARGPRTFPDCRDLHRTLRAGRGRVAGHDDTDPEHTIAFACLMAGRNLTRDEWTQAFGDRPLQANLLMSWPEM